jgi:hypothetical protein
MNSLDPPEHVFIHHSCFVQDFALRLRAGRSDIKSRYDSSEFEATAHMHLHAFIRVVPDAPKGRDSWKHRNSVQSSKHTVFIGRRKQELQSLLIDRV